MTTLAQPDTCCHHPERERRLSMEGLLPYVPRSARRVLDCTGRWEHRAAALRAHGATEVIALADATAGPAPADHGYDAVIQGPLDFVALPPVNPGFDCIVCGDALERLRNPEAFLPRLMARLVPGGLFLAVVPNMQYHKIVCALAEGRWVYGERGVWGRDNLRFFTARELAWLMNLTGAASCKIGSHVADGPEEFPRDGDGYARAGRLKIGPIEDGAYPAWLTEYYLVLAVKAL